MKIVNLFYFFIYLFILFCNIYLIYLRYGNTFFFSEEPKPNHLCPRKNGYFAHPDESVCNIFYNCIEGDATEIICPSGLHFDEYSGTCVWPESAGRTGCGEADSSELIR